MGNNTQIITVVDAPEVTLADGQKAGDLLLNFYRALGWNGDDYLDPCKIRTTNAVYDGLYDQIYEIYPNPVAVGMLLVNSGPGTDAHIPPGRVYLYEGWVKPTDPREGEEVNEYCQQAA